MKRGWMFLIGMMTAAAGNAAILTWTGATGDYGDPANWGGSTPAAGDELRISNGGTATITTGNNYFGGKLLLGRGASGVGHLSMTGGALTLNDLPSLSVADGSGSSSILDMSGSSILTTSGNILVGARGTGTMTVGSDASVSSAALFFSSAAGGTGTLDLAGSWTASGWVNMGHATLAVGNSTFNMNGGSLSASGFDVRANGTHALNVNGSDGSFSVDGNFTANLGNFTLSFLADAGGFTMLEIGGAVNVDGAVLHIDLAGHELEEDLVLIRGGSLDGSFSSIGITGGPGREQVIYDRDNGELRLAISELGDYGLMFSIIGKQKVMTHLSLPSVFSNHMILQQGCHVPVWGTAEPGDLVTVSFAGQEKNAVAGSDGTWRLALDALQASAVPRIMVVRTPGAERRFYDVLVGEVWLCSGQSNMYRPIAGIPGVASSQVEGYEEILALSENATLRIFCDDGHALWGAMQWQRARSETLELFSGVAYFFGMRIQSELDVPVGLLLVSRVGTTIQAWTPWEYAMQVPVTQHYRALYEENIDEIRAYNQAPAPKPELSEELLIARTFATVGGLYANWMSAVVPFAIRGVLWYQGESNATWEPTARQYDGMLSALASGLRGEWARPAMPFYFVQLPNWAGATSTHWPWIRQSMLHGVLSIPNSGMAVTVDVGLANDLHPPKKKQVGDRLALWALSDTYGVPRTVSGPLPLSATSETIGVRIQFNTFGSVLNVPGGTWTDLEAAGADGLFYPAVATFGVSDALITTPEVDEPVTVRYGWKPDFTPSLFNADGLPASPFSFVREENGIWRLRNGNDDRKVNNFY